MKQVKKVLALLLGAALLLGLLPMAALAADDDFVSRVEFAVALYESPAFSFSGKTYSGELPFDDLDGLTGEQLNAIGVLFEEGHMNGFAPGVFDPFRLLTRADAFLIMWRVVGGSGGAAQGVPPYQDIEPDAYYYAALCDLYARGILTDEDMDENGNFRPWDNVTVAEMNAWLKGFEKEAGVEDAPKEPEPDSQPEPDPKPGSDPSTSTPSDPAPKELTRQGLAEELYRLGLFKGVDDTGKNFDLDRAANRVEGLVMLIRLLGREEAALSGAWSHPFLDVPEWADKHVGYAFENGITNGVSDTEFDSGSAVTVNMYLTYVLRALGYSDDNGDFDWEEPYELAAQAGVLPSAVDRENFLRGDMVVISAAALGAKLKNSSRTLAEKLIADGVFTQTDYNAAELVRRVPREWPSTAA